MDRTIRLDKADEMVLSSAREVWVDAGRDRPFWPEPFAHPTPEAAWSFIRELRTWNEAEGAIQPFPDKRYLKELAREWIECRATARPFVVEKCRRMVVSWLFRALELHAMGLARD